MGKCLNEEGCDDAGVCIFRTKFPASKDFLDGGVILGIEVQPGPRVRKLRHAPYELLSGPHEDGRMRVDEYKFYTVWGKVVFGESVPFSSGAAMEIDREGNVFSTIASCPPHCVPACYDEMVRRAERLATGAQTDFLR